MSVQETSHGGADVIDAIRNLVQVLIVNYGRWGTLGIIAALVLITGGWKIYNLKRKDREINLAIKEKDKTIQRLAEQERNYRILFFKKIAGWSDEEISKFIMKNEFDDVPSARRSLEEENPPDSN